MNFDELRRAALDVTAPRELSPTATAGDAGAALLSASGTVYTGVCIDTACSLGFCAEHAAAAAMVTGGEHHVSRMVAVDAAGQVLPPCGRCREFIAQLHEHNLDAEVMVADATVVPLRELLPFDWRAEPAGEPSPDR